MLQQGSEPVSVLCLAFWSDPLPHNQAIPSLVCDIQKTAAPLLPGLLPIFYSNLAQQCNMSKVNAGFLPFRFHWICVHDCILKSVSTNHICSLKCDWVTNALGNQSEAGVLCHLIYQDSKNKLFKSKPATWGPLNIFKLQCVCRPHCNYDASLRPSLHHPPLPSFIQPHTTTHPT